MPSIIPTAYAAANMQQFTSNVLTPVIREIVNPIIWLMFGVATVVFIYGVLQMIIKGDDATAREAGQKSMLCLHNFNFVISKVFEVPRSNQNCDSTLFSNQNCFS